MKYFFLIHAPLLLVSLLFTGCFSTNPELISVDPERIDRLPLKTTALTDQELKHWNQYDLSLDTIPGMSVDRAYDVLLKGRKGTPVIVGVIDSGIDINHEDLKGRIWVNPKEIPSNNKDDDGNGYIDDINGWNFLGDIVAENMEFTRVIRDYASEFDGKTFAQISEDKKDLYQLYVTAKQEYNKELQENKQSLSNYTPMLAKVKSAHAFMESKLSKANYTYKEAAAVITTTDIEKENQQVILNMYGNLSTGEFIPDFIKNFQEYVDSLKERQATHYNLDLNARKVLNNDENDLSTNIYGNNQVGGPDPKLKDAKHGTHVAGIIAANRKNNSGGKGIADDHVKIMAIRAVPDGDEYDKDIALAIRYAVDNGAKVINTSFGKYYSTHPEWVREAIKYAAKKDVLIVNAAGNDAKDLDTVNVYPNDQTLEIPEISENFITVAALSPEYGSKLVASFSNFGKSNVDVFAPGVKIYASTPLNTYEYLRGTSMAAPAVAGVAAVLRSYFPKLSAKQIKEAILKSGNTTQTSVVLGNGSTQKFNEISKSGKMVNLFNAILWAQKM